MPRSLALVLIATTLLAARPASADRPLAHHAARLAKHAGQGIGFGAGVLVTATLALSKKWNTPLSVVQVDGQPVVLRQRHRPILGPQILRSAESIRATTPLAHIWRTFLKGVATGATAAPQAEALYEAHFLKMLHGL